MTMTNKERLAAISSDITFREDIHEYRNGADEVLTSVTTCLHHYKVPFDEFGHITRAVARKRGITVEEVQKEWKDKTDRACTYGTAVHLAIENYLNNGVIVDNEYKDIVKSFARIKFDGEVFSEIRLQSKLFKLAGTSDIVVVKNNLVTISDLKTNESFLFEPKYNNYFLYPISHLPECHHTTYSLQILIYGRMVQEHGFDFEPGELLWLDRETNKIRQINVLPLHKEVDDLLNHYIETKMKEKEVKDDDDFAPGMIWDEFSESFFEVPSKKRK